MPRLPRPNVFIRTELTGPERSPARDKLLKLVKHIDINPRITSLLEKPTWSVASLMPLSSFSGIQQSEPEITREKLRHLLRLSALPPPASVAEEARMLSTLAQQIHFVKEIQKVDTDGVEPLVAIRDETADARYEGEITKESLAEFIALEQKRGKNGTIRRRKDVEPTRVVHKVAMQRKPEKGDDRIQDPFQLGDGDQDGTDRKKGQYFFVKRSKKEDTAGEGG